jgi:hypothetical protein
MRFERAATVMSLVESLTARLLASTGAITDEPYDSNWSRTGPWGASGAIPAPTRQRTERTSRSNRFCDKLIEKHQIRRMSSLAGRSISWTSKYQFDRAMGDGLQSLQTLKSRVGLDWNRICNEAFILQRTSRMKGYAATARPCAPCPRARTVPSGRLLCPLLASVLKSSAV